MGSARINNRADDDPIRAFILGEIDRQGVALSRVARDARVAYQTLYRFVEYPPGDRAHRRLHTASAARVVSVLGGRLTRRW